MLSVASERKPAQPRRSRVTPTRAASGPLWRQYLKALGPGLVTGASDDDPSGIATYSQAGAKFGFGLLWAVLVALIGANALNIAADLAAIGEGVHLLHAGPPWLWALLAGAGTTVLVMTGSFETIARVFKVLCVALLAYLGVLFVVKVDWLSVASHTFVPHITFSAGYLMLLVAVLGTTISPYLFFWQSAHRIEELRDEPEGGEDAA